MSTTKPMFAEGTRVLVQGWGYTMAGEVVGKTVGECTRIKFDDGQTMLISNKIIRLDPEHTP